MKKICLLLVVLALDLIPFTTLAFRLAPMVLNFQPEGAKITQVLTVENPTREKIPIQIEAFNRSVDAKGEEVRTRTDDFTIYPEQLVLLPNEKRNIRLTWQGKINGNLESAYRIIATQIPVEFKEKKEKATKAGVNLNFILQYVASAYVTPAKATAKIKVTSAEIKDGTKLTLVISNEGEAHKVLLPKSLILKSDKDIVLKMDKVPELESHNLLAKTEKTFTVNLPKKLSVQKVSAEMELMETGD